MIYIVWLGFMVYQPLLFNAKFAQSAGAVEYTDWTSAEG